MSWNAKPSGSVEIERRAQPYFTDAMKSEITERYLPRFETKHGALIPALHMVQHAEGWIPPQALEEIAAFLDLAPADALDTASFYEEFHLKPKGRRVLAVCRSIACEFCDHKAVTDAARKKLGVEVGETTDDGEFTLIELECMGSCGSAPVALLDDDLHEFITPERVEQIIDSVKAGRVPAVERTTSDLKTVGKGDGH